MEKIIIKDLIVKFSTNGNLTYQFYGYNKGLFLKPGRAISNRKKNPPIYQSMNLHFPIYITIIDQVNEFVGKYQLLYVLDKGILGIDTIQDASVIKAQDEEFLQLLTKHLRDFLRKNLISSTLEKNFPNVYSFKKVIELFKEREELILKIREDKTNQRLIHQYKQLQKQSCKWHQKQTWIDAKNSYLIQQGWITFLAWIFPISYTRIGNDIPIKEVDFSIYDRYIGRLFELK